MIPWLTNNFCALALALNSTGKVRKAKREDDPKRMIPIQIRVGSCSSSTVTRTTVFKFYDFHADLFVWSLLRPFSLFQALAFREAVLPLM